MSTFRIVLLASHLAFVPLLAADAQDSNKQGLPALPFRAGEDGQEGEKIVSLHKATMTRPPENIPSHGAVDAPLLGNGDLLAAIGGKADRLSFYINKNDLWIMKAAGGSSVQPLARLDLCFPDMTGATYRVEQDLRTAVTTGSFDVGERSLSLETGVAATENLLWVKLAARKGTIRGSAELQGPSRTVDGVRVAERRFDQGVSVPAGAACAVWNASGGDAGNFTLEPGKPVVLVAAVNSLIETNDYRSSAVKRARNATLDHLAALRKAHEEWWRKFWNESFIEIPDKVIEQRYYLSQYVMASASRLPDFPPGLFGWVTTVEPAWGGDYHMNYNFMAPFYGLYAANHIAQADPCNGPILANLEKSRALCRETLGIEGLLQVVGIGPKGSLADCSLHGQKSNSSYSCVPLASRWYATYDLEFGRKAYPFVRATAVFWEHWLKFENGRYVIYKDAIHEGSGEDVNPLLSLGLVRMVMNLALDMSKELGVDSQRRKNWADIRDHLSDYPKCTVRDIFGNSVPNHLAKEARVLDLPIFRYTEKGLAWYGSNTLGIQHIYPAGAIGLDSPSELLERARNQVKVMARWTDFNGMNSFYAAAARVGYDPHIILGEMRSMLAGMALPNGMIRGNVHGMEHQSIVPNAIQEMLMQSHEGTIRFFPCWPKEMDARFGTLRARGAFLVSAELKRGEVGSATIMSEKGRDFVVQNPWPDKSVTVIRNGNKAETLTGKRLSLKTIAGECIILMPCAGPAAIDNRAMKGQ